MCNKEEKHFSIQVEESSVDTGKKIIGVQLPISMYNRVKEIADQKFLSVSDIVRSVLFKYLEENKD